MRICIFPLPLGRGNNDCRRLPRCFRRVCDQGQRVPKAHALRHVCPRAHAGACRGAPRRCGPQPPGPTLGGLYRCATHNPPHHPSTRPWASHLARTPHPRIGAENDRPVPRRPGGRALLASIQNFAGCCACAGGISPVALSPNCRAPRHTSLVLAFRITHSSH